MNRLVAGTAIERYVVEGLLGEGSTAEVYKLRDTRSGLAYALKVLTTDSTTIRRRMLQEGEIQFQLTHPNVVGVVEVLDIDGQAGLLMEFVRGPSLAQLLRRYRPTDEEAVSLFGGILSGVDAAHKIGLIHRDLKPENVLLANSPSGLLPKVTDFGIAKAPGEPDKRSTRPGIAMGTPSYMSPEQVRDASSADRRSDLFALGAILYELTTGRVAFDGDTVFDIMRKVVDGVYRPPKDLRPDLDTRIASAINGCLRKDPESRLQDCNTVAAVLAGVAVAREVRDVLPDRVPPGSPMIAIARGLSHSTPAPAPERQVDAPSVPQRFGSLEPPDDDFPRDPEVFGSIVDFEDADDAPSRAGPSKLEYQAGAYGLPAPFPEDEAQPTVIDTGPTPSPMRSAMRPPSRPPPPPPPPPQTAPPRAPTPAPAGDWDAAPTVIGDDARINAALNEPEELDLDLEQDTGDAAQPTVIDGAPQADDEQQTTVVAPPPTAPTPAPHDEQQTTVVAPYPQRRVDTPQPTQPPVPPPTAERRAPKTAPKAEWRPGQTDEVPKPPKPTASSAKPAPRPNNDFTDSPTGTMTVRTGVVALGLSAMLTSGGLLAIIAAAVVIAVGAILMSGESSIDPADIAPPIEALEPLDEPEPASPEPDASPPDPDDASGDEADPGDEADQDDEASAAPPRAEAGRTASTPARPAERRPPPRKPPERRPTPQPEGDLFGDEPPPPGDIDLGGDGAEITFDDLGLDASEMLDPPGKILVDNQKGEVEFRAPGERYAVGEPMPPGRYDIYANFGKDLLVRAGSVQVGSGETITLKCKASKKTCAP